MVAGKRRIERRPKQERRGLDSEWTWSAPDQNDDLVQEQRARSRNDGDEDKSLAAFTLCSCSAEKPNECERDIQQVGAKSAESDRQHIDESLPACQSIDGREEVVIHLAAINGLFLGRYGNSLFLGRYGRGLRLASGGARVSGSNSQYGSPLLECPSLRA